MFYRVIYSIKNYSAFQDFIIEENAYSFIRALKVFKNLGIEIRGIHFSDLSLIILEELSGKVLLTEEL